MSGVREIRDEGLSACEKQDSRDPDQKTGDEHGQAQTEGVGGHTDEEG